MILHLKLCVMKLLFEIESDDKDGAVRQDFSHNSKPAELSGIPFTSAPRMFVVLLLWQLIYLRTLLQLYAAGRSRSGVLKNEALIV